MHTIPSVPTFFIDIDSRLQQTVFMKINRREAGTGHVQAYHREDCFYESARLKLKGFDAASLYVVKAYDSQDTTLISGKERMEEGLLIVIPEQPGAATVAYSKALH